MIGVPESMAKSNIRLRMTFEDYDSFLERINGIHTPVFWPGIEDLDLMEQDPKKWMLFACYLDEAGSDPKTKEELYRRKSLRQYINSHLELCDELEERLC